MLRGTRGNAWLGLIALLGTLPAAAAEQELELSATGGWTDNVERSDSNEQESGYAGLGVDWQLLKDGGRLTGSAAVNAEVQHFLSGRADTELVGGGTASGQLVLVPGRLVWTASDRFGQQQRNPFGNDNPANREQVNQFSTGPRLLWGSGDRTSGSLSASWSDVWYENTDNDSNRTTVAADVRRLVGRDLGLTLDTSATHIEYENSAASDAKRYESSIGLDGSQGKVQGSVRVGWNRYDGERSDNSGTLFDGQLTVDTSPTSSLSFRANQSISDAAGLFRANQSAERVRDRRDAFDIAATDDGFRQRQFNAGWRLAQRRTTLALQLNWSQEEYLNDQQFDKDSRSARVSVSRQLNRRLRANAAVALVQRSFVTLDQDDDDTSVRLGIRYQLGPRTTIGLNLSRVDRDSDQLDGDSTEHRVMLRFNYQPLLSSSSS